MAARIRLSALDEARFKAFYFRKKAAGYSRKNILVAFATSTGITLPGLTKLKELYTKWGINRPRSLPELSPDALYEAVMAAVDGDGHVVSQRGYREIHAQIASLRCP